LLTVAWTLAQQPGAAGDGAIKRLLVMPLEARAGVEARKAAVMGDLLNAEARRIPGFVVITQADLEKLLTVEMQKQMLGCSGDSCLAELGGALNADEILHGSVGRLGGTELVLSLSRLDARAARVLGSESERLSGASDELVLDHVPMLLRRLYPAYTLPPLRNRGLHPALTLLTLTVLGGTVQYAALAGVLASFVFSGWLPVQLVVLGASLGVLLAAPLYVAWLQAWMLDLVGKRQAGIRWAALVGLGLMLMAGTAALLPVAVGAGIAAVSTAVNLVMTLMAAARGQAPSPSRLAGGVGAGMAVGAVGVVPGVLAMVIGVPLIQGLILYFTSEQRPVDAEAAWPGLFSPHEKRPAWAPHLPGPLDSLWGGAPEPAASKEK
jgi:hypothetical protein